MSLPRVELKVDGFSGRIVWFRKMVRRSDLEPGTLVDVFDKKGVPLGPGFYNPRSELAVRLMAKVDAFSGAEPKWDNQTVVVLRVE